MAQPADGGWQWGLELRSYGYQGNERPLSGVPAAKADGQRLSYQWDAAVQEWFVNDPRGLEHGFTVSERPGKNANPLSATSNPLVFTLGVRGGLHPAITADARDVQFNDDHGTTVITYAGLKVWDADGKSLHSTFEPAGTGVRLLIGDQGARYPITKWNWFL